MAAGKGEDMAWISRKTYEHLEEMLDAAIAEEFEESAYDESEMSRLETKWKRFLSASALSEDNVKKSILRCRRWYRIFRIR